MFGARVFILKAALVWIIISVVLVESARHKKDVHHMIILNEEVRPSKSHRHKHSSHSSRSKRRPSKKTTRKPPVSSHSSEESSFEITEENEDSNESSHVYTKQKPHHRKPSSSRHSKRPHKHQYKKTSHKSHRNEHHQSHHWAPMSSKELFGSPPPSFSNGFPTGALQYPYQQMVPMEITTPFTMPSNFINFGSTLYPPLELNQFAPNAGQMSPMIGAVETYKPFDYSVLKQNNRVRPTQKYVEEEVNQSKGVTDDQSAAASNGGAAFAIMVDNPNHEPKEKRKEETRVKDGSTKKERGAVRLRIKKKQ
ncbi:uncharacterized protein LOC126747380 [Anthonomus grandis grandis]|uniref:uncharacterized protein LOC126747380 n=1 Tax=Anthonomus grandis grandis TaxID=2921223 RepID=UPI00216592B7|nr:uncharacterized protein LOC126747380 [Anthonomus grandis grandis]XP_050311922.1 uncharacterized protein LOC126747380 [Anthonomus grandis grandis]